MSDKKQEWFVAERARTLALLQLTRRADLVVKERGRDIGLEYLVYLRKEGEAHALRPFGVFLRGAGRSVTGEQLNRVLRPTMQSFQRLS